MKNLVIIPTYQEKENIEMLVPSVLEICPDVHILVVDDNSPDGTAEAVKELATNDQRVHLLLRQKKEGLGKAYLAGFEWGLERGYDSLTEMDADFSHRPLDLKKLIETLHEFDAAVGSRYVEGGGTRNWGLGRKILSRGGGLYARSILGYPLNDWTGGFNSWSAKVLRNIHLKDVQSEGYSFQIELKYRALKAGFSVKEVPILFEDRRVGQSKMSSRIVLEALHRVWQIRLGVKEP